jgi:hypothetical protein
MIKLLRLTFSLDTTIIHAVNMSHVLAAECNVLIRFTCLQSAAMIQIPIVSWAVLAPC